jgi:chromosome segregation ATPase
VHKSPSTRLATDPFRYQSQMRNLGKESNESATRERRRHDLRVEELELAVDSHRHKAATLEVRCCDLEMVVVSQKTQIVSLSDSLKEARDETDTLRREIESTSTSMHSLKQSSAKSAQAATQSEARLVKVTRPQIPISPRLRHTELFTNQQTKRQTTS